MNELWAGIKGFMLDEEGATAVEYGVMVALIIAAVVVIVALLGNQIKAGFSKVSSTLTGAGMTGS